MTDYSEHIGNTFRAERIFDRLDSSHLVVEVAQIVLHEGDEPDALADLRDAHVLPGEDVTEMILRPWKQIRPQCVTLDWGKMSPMCPEYRVTYLSGSTIGSNGVSELRPFLF